VVLVDLPGLNDPNSAREQVTKKYLHDAQYIWLVCNSQTGIDRVFTNVLRDEGLLFRLFLEGRLGAFSVITTRAEDFNLQAVLEQMGIDVDSFDGNVLPVLDFRRNEISRQVQDHLLSIAMDIVAKAAGAGDNTAFLQRIRSIAVFAVATAAYLHDRGQMPLYQGMKLSAKDTHIPQLIDHLHAITREESYRSQVEAATKQLDILYEQVRHFFFDGIRRIEQDSEESRREWDGVIKVGSDAIRDGREALTKLRIRLEESLEQRCGDFERQLSGFDAQAIAGLKAVFERWEPIPWNTLRSVAEKGGVWRNYKGREFDFNMDVARAYQDLLPLVWDDFFGTHLSELTGNVSDGAREALRMTAARITGAMGMLCCQPAGVRDSLEKSLRTAEESFQLQTGQTRAELARHIRQTRQDLTTGMIEAATSFMLPAYERAAAEPDGKGIKKRMLEHLVQRARQHAGTLFVNMSQDLAEGVTALKSSMRPQLSRIVNYGSAILDQFEHNLSSQKAPTTVQFPVLEVALRALPQLEVHRERLSQEAD
jgi:hypothetical protein